MIIRALALLVLSSISLNAVAVIINSNNFGAGTNFSNPDENTTFTHVYSRGNPRVNYSEEVTVKESLYAPDFKYFGSEGTTSSTYFSLAALFHPSSNLDDILTQPNPHFGSNFAMLLLSYVEPTRQLAFKGFENGGDGFRVVTFDKNKNLISHIRLSSSEEKELMYHGELQNTYHYNYTVNFSTDTYYVLFGGSDTHTLVYEINTHVPEPSAIALLLVCLLALFLKFRKLIQ